MLLRLLYPFGALAGCGGPSETSNTASGSAEEQKFELIGGINLDTEHPYYLGMVKFAELMEENPGAGSP